jgi:hypothetical protein
MEIKNAIIKKAFITTRDGFLDSLLTLDYGGASQSFGGWCLYLPKSYSHYKLQGPAGHFICRVMEIAGVTDWDRLEGKTIRVKADYTKVYAIGHIVNNDWFAPDADFREKKERSNE